MRTALRACGLFVGFGVVVASATAFRGDNQDLTAYQPATEPVKPAEPAKPVEPVKPVDGGKPADSGKPGDAAKPDDAPAATQPENVPAVVESYVLNFSLNDIDGKEQNLEQYKGKVVLMVNVASKCGFTSQYKGLEALYQKYKDKGLVVLGFPSNDFGGQEPGADADIKSFCQANYKVTFPLFSKIKVTGTSAHPLYQRLAAQPGAAGGVPKWNFNKFLVGRDGKVIERFDSRVKPDGDDLTKQVETALAAK